MIEHFGMPGSHEIYEEYSYILSDYMSDLDENDRVIIENDMLVVMDSTNIYRSNDYGYMDVMDNRVLYENDYIYVPASRVYNSDYLDLEEAVLFSPVFDSRQFTLFMALGEYYYNMVQYFYGMSNQYSETDDYAYLYSVGDVYEIYTFSVETGLTSISDTSSYEEAAENIVHNYDTIVSSRTFADAENEYS